MSSNQKKNPPPPSSSSSSSSTDSKSSSSRAKSTTNSKTKSRSAFTVSNSKTTKTLKTQFSGATSKASKSSVRSEPNAVTTLPQEVRKHTREEVKQISSPTTCLTTKVKSNPGLTSGTNGTNGAQSDEQNIDSSLTIMKSNPGTEDQSTQSSTKQSTSNHSVARDTSYEIYRKANAPSNSNPPLKPVFAKVPPKVKPGDRACKDILQKILPGTKSASKNNGSQAQCDMAGSNVGSKADGPKENGEDQSGSKSNTGSK